MPAFQALSDQNSRTADSISSKPVGFGAQKRKKKQEAKSPITPSAIYHTARAT